LTGHVGEQEKEWYKRLDGQVVQLFGEAEQVAHVEAQALQMLLLEFE
jgi:hypothetical protein